MGGLGNFASGLQQGYGFVEDIQRNREMDKIRKDAYDQRLKEGSYTIDKLGREKKYEDAKEQARMAGMLPDSLQSNPYEDGPSAQPGLSKVEAPYPAGLSSSPAIQPVQPSIDGPGVQILPVRAPGDPVGPSQVQSPAQQPQSPGLKPVAAPSDSTDALIESALKSQRWAVKNGYPGIAMEYSQMTMPLREGLRMKEFDKARAKYFVTKDPAEFLPAFNKYVDNGLSINKIDTIPGKDGEKSYQFSGTTDDGKPYQGPPMSSKDFEDLVSSTRDAKTFHAAEAQYREKLLNSQLKILEEQAKRPPFHAPSDHTILAPDGKVIQRGQPNLQHVQVEGPDGTKTVGAFNPRDGSVRHAGGVPEPLPQTELSKYEMDMTKRAGDAALKIYFGGATDISKLDEKTRPIAIDTNKWSQAVIIGSRDTDYRHSLTDGTANAIGYGLATGSLSVKNEPTGRFVAFEGKKYLLDPRAAPQSAGPTSSSSGQSMPQEGAIAKGERIGGAPKRGAAERKMAAFMDLENIPPDTPEQVKYNIAALEKELSDPKAPADKRAVWKEELAKNMALLKAMDAPGLKPVGASPSVAQPVTSAAKPVPGLSPVPNKDDSMPPAEAELSKLMTSEEDAQRRFDDVNSDYLKATSLKGSQFMKPEVVAKIKAERAKAQAALDAASSAVRNGNAKYRVEVTKQRPQWADKLEASYK